MLPTTLAMIILKPVAGASYFVRQRTGVTLIRDQSTKLKVRRSFLFTTNMLFRIHNPDDRAVRRSVFAFERKARFFPPAPENQFTDTGARRIDGNQWFSLWL